ncbi:SDR family oxidoreductase [Streptomyces sp. NPDC058746]|uniref:SDR family oxidoreductase n=1 Tax=Streptomyces sp. NPDC058746 TaxID=3346622 RepID=UPI00367BB3D8
MDQDVLYEIDVPEPWSRSHPHVRRAAEQRAHREVRPGPPVGGVAGIDGAAKAGLMALVCSAAVEPGPRGVRVNAVAPGVVWTPRVAALLGAEGRRRNAENAPLGRVAETSDIAAALYFLASPLSSHVDGEVGVKFPYPTTGGEQ